MTLYQGVTYNWMTRATRPIQQKFWACNIQYQLRNLPGYIVERFLWYQEQYTLGGETKHAVHTSRYSHSYATEPSPNPRSLYYLNYSQAHGKLKRDCRALLFAYNELNWNVLIMIPQNKSKHFLRLTWATDILFYFRLITLLRKVDYCNFNRKCYVITK
jgi:hypothetical protein